MDALTTVCLPTGWPEFLLLSLLSQEGGRALQDRDIAVCFVGLRAQLQLTN
jgi:hypothetical protein